MSWRDTLIDRYHNQGAATKREAYDPVPAQRIFQRSSLKIIGAIACVFFIGGTYPSRSQSVEFAQQPANKVWLYPNPNGTGLGGIYLQANQVAGIFTPYALIAAKTYDTPLALNLLFPFYDPFKLTPDVSPASKPDNQESKKPYNWLNGRWAPVDEKFWKPTSYLAPSADCFWDRPGCLPRGIPVGGLEMQVWRSVPNKGACGEIAIAFRGTQFKSIDDWVANFHWLNRLLPLDDQYDQVRRHISNIVASIKKFPCYKSSTRIVAVGHSLGAGLAQLAAYVHGDIRNVYAFDPSFVTGYLDVDSDTRNKNRVGLKINRIFERGEILSIPRAIAEDVTGLPRCNPRIQLVRFNTLSDWNPITQHKMERLAFNLFAAKDGPVYVPLKVGQQKKATKRRTCADDGDPFLF